MKNLVLLAYGRDTEYFRAIFCILSFVAWSKDYRETTRIIVYTDKPESFSPYLNVIDVVYHLLTPKILDEMLDNTNFFHRRKVAVIDLTFKEFPLNDLLFIDSDTFFIADPKSILTGFEQGKSFMHKREYNFKEGLKLFTSFNQAEYPEAFLRFISGREFKIGGITEVFTDSDYSWNSGVLGLNKEFSKFMPDVFSLTDQFYANSKWFICEQLAFSLVLQKRTEIRSTDTIVLHYWGNRQKLLMDGLLSDFLNKRTDIHLFDKNTIRAITKEFKKKVDIDLIIEQIEIAYALNNKLYGFKKTLSLIFKNPINFYSYKQIFKTLSQKPITN